MLTWCDKLGWDVTENKLIRCLCSSSSHLLWNSLKNKKITKLCVIYLSSHTKRTIITGSYLSSLHVIWNIQWFREDQRFKQEPFLNEINNLRTIEEKILCKNCETMLTLKTPHNIKFYGINIPKWKAFWKEFPPC